MTAIMQDAPPPVIPLVRAGGRLRGSGNPGERLPGAEHDECPPFSPLLTPHGERLPARDGRRRRSWTSPNPSWGTITGLLAAPCGPADALLTPHGERLRDHEAEIPRRGDRLLTPHGERLRREALDGEGPAEAPNPSWGTITTAAGKPTRKPRSS